MPEQGILPLKAPVSPTSSQLQALPTEATLQSLYSRATRAFLHRDIVLTTTLIESAFTMLQSPPTPTPDPLDPHRRKWDILRITLESTIYSSHPERDTLPASLRETLLLSPQSFVATAHARSLALFTPSLLPRKPTSAFLPHQVLITLVASSIKVECPTVGKELVEDWLANRGQYEFVISTGEAYERVLELYCLRILPLLEEWDYAKEILLYERELSSEKKHGFQTTLETLHAQTQHLPAKEASTTPSIVSPRSPSPSPSASSSSSSLSTLSTRTAVPLSRADPGPSRLRRSGSASSSATDATVTKRSSSRPQQKHIHGVLVNNLVKRGVAAQHPSKYVLDEQELERISALARIELEDARVELERAHEAAKKMGKGAEGAEADDANEDDVDEWIDEEDDPMAMDEDKPTVDGAAKTDDLSQYNLDEYDDDVKEEGIGPFSNIKGLTFYRANTDDPYITLKDDEEDDERGELEILPTDNLLVTAKTEDEVSQLEIYVYDESQENLYVHHDLMLPHFPLCLEWLDFPPASSSSMQTDGPAQFGNYVAVGTLDPEIEIWSLDVVESMYPDMVLGRPDKTAAHIPVPAGTGKKKRKKTKHRPISDSHHVDAVLCLSWNRTHRHMLASASADRTVKLWDLSRAPVADEEGNGESAGAIRSFGVHKDKVQAVQWNEKEPTVLLSGSYDRTVRVFDSRAPDMDVGAVLGADVEALRWDPWESHAFYVSLENGLVLNFDARSLSTGLKTPSPARFTISAHDGAVSALDVSPLLRGCICTGGTDKLVKVWNVDQTEGGKPSVSMVASRDLEVGKVFSAVFSPDDPLTIAAAGSKAKLQIWDVGANFGARKAFATKLTEAGRVVKEKEGGGVVGLVNDEEDSEEDGNGDD
ncbi:WD40-repeat-containing domain protein [Phlebopus sp. FC_14]|nr:WD40-repeat-containing domain protein [Phlebopus sp. FC_14]